MEPPQTAAALCWFDVLWPAVFIGQEEQLPVFLDHWFGEGKAQTQAWHRSKICTPKHVRLTEHRLQLPHTPKQPDGASKEIWGVPVITENALCFILIHLLSRKENTSFIRCCVTGVKYNRLRRKVKQLPIWDYKRETPLSSFPQNHGFYRHNKMAHVHRSHWLPWVFRVLEDINEVYLAHPAGLGTVWWLSLCSWS